MLSAITKCSSLKTWFSGIVLPTGVKYLELRSAKVLFSITVKLFLDSKSSISLAEYNDIQGSPTLADPFVIKLTAFSGFE